MLQDAKLNFRELGSPTGEALIEAIQASPHRKFDLEQRRAPMPVRDVPSDVLAAERRAPALRYR